MMKMFRVFLAIILVIVDQFDYNVSMFAELLVLGLDCVCDCFL